ncbi:MAG TPA: hypothetical protein VH257_10525 [Chloroflexota bacterium]|jgi:hypothetical protein|nr:hypothetical protein [Chloroflexota bacterium]
MNKRRRVALKKRRKTRERLKAKEKGASGATAPAIGSRRTSTS